MFICLLCGNGSYSVWPQRLQSRKLTQTPTPRADWWTCRRLKAEFDLCLSLWEWKASAGLFVVASRLLLRTEEFGRNDGGRPGLDSSLGFSVASNHRGFTASCLAKKLEALIASCKHSPTHGCTRATLNCFHRDVSVRRSEWLQGSTFSSWKNNWGKKQNMLYCRKHMHLDACIKLNISVHQDELNPQVVALLPLRRN